MIAIVAQVAVVVVISSIHRVVLRMNGLEEPADATHKLGEALEESVNDMGEMLDITRMDITDLISGHMTSLGQLIEEWTKIQEQK